jgi:hypothetical protein
VFLQTQLLSEALPSDFRLILDKKLCKA